MKYISYLLTVGLLLSFQASQAMDETFALPEPIINACNGRVIDQNSIPGLAPVMSGELKEVVDAWTNKYKELLHALIPETNNVVVVRDNLNPSYQQGNQVLKNNGLTNLSKLNYIVELPRVEEIRYFMQASGPVNKAISILHGNEFHWDDIKDKLTDELTKMDTFQTVSRVVGYLRAQDVIKEQGITTFKVPKTYLAQIPGRESNVEYGACDANSIVIQEDIGDNYVQIRSNLNLLPNVNGQTLKDTFMLIKHVPLWDINGNGLIDKNTYMLGQSDLEQPNNENPKNFFNKNVSKYQWSIACGIEGIVKLYQEANKTCDVSEGCRVLKELIEQDQDLQQSPHWPYIKNQCIQPLEDMLKQ